MEVKSGKMVIFIFIRGILLNQSIFFLFQSSNNCLTSYFLSFWSNLIQSRAYIAVHQAWQCIVKKALFLCFLRSVLIAYLITWGLEKNFFYYYYYFRYEPRALLDSRAVSVELKEYVLKS